jgi:hypothetical protein
MCKLCNGTHVVHEKNSLGYRFSGCPKCRPEEKESVGLKKVLAWINEMEKEATIIDHH